VKAIGAVDAGDPAGEDADGTPRGSNPGPLDEKVTRVVARMAETESETPSVKRARARVREALGLSLTDKEIARAIERALLQKET